MSNVTPIKQPETTNTPPQKMLVVMATKTYLLVQPNFDIPAGAVLQILPQSGTQVLGQKPEENECQEPSSS